MNPDGRVERAGQLYERAVFGGDMGALATAERELDAVEADLSLARGRIVHGRFLEERREEPRELTLFERAATPYGELGDVRGEGEALFWVGVYHQVVRHDVGTAIPFLERSLELAGLTGDTLTMSYALGHLGLAAHAAGRLEEARERLEESVRMRREIGFMAGVAANMVGLIYIAAAEGRRDDALALAAEAAEIAETSDAEAIIRQVEETRARLRRPAGVSSNRILHQDYRREEANVAYRNIDQRGRCAGDERGGAGGGADGILQGLGRDGDLGRLQGASGGQDLPHGPAPSRGHYPPRRHRAGNGTFGRVRHAGGTEEGGGQARRGRGRWARGHRRERQSDGD